MSIADLYKTRVLDHHHHPRRHGELQGATHAAEGVNALCGDRIAFQARCEDGVIAAVAFTGQACAIGTATASMLGDVVERRALDEVDAMRDTFAAWLASSDGTLGPSFGELDALAELRKYPARHKCALLPFETLCAALAGRASTTTEATNP